MNTMKNTMPPFLHTNLEGDMPIQEIRLHCSEWTNSDVWTQRIVPTNGQDLVVGQASLDRTPRHKRQLTTSIAQHHEAGQFYASDLAEA